jgi:hypothetical protein
MTFEILALCDASTINGGKINILGTFDTFSVESDPPILIPLCSVAAKLRFMANEEGTKSLRLEVIDSDGNLIVRPIDGQINVQVPSPESSSSLPLSLMVVQLALPHFGDYEVVLSIGEERASVPLYVKQIPARPV